MDSGPGFLKLLAVILTKGDGVIFQSLAFLPRSYKPGVSIIAGESSQVICCFRGSGVSTTVQQSLSARSAVILPSQKEISQRCPSMSLVFMCQSALLSVLLDGHCACACHVHQGSFI